jgi:hypothetical protein
MYKNTHNNNKKVYVESMFGHVKKGGRKKGNKTYFLAISACSFL